MKLLDDLLPRIYSKVNEHVAAEDNVKAAQMQKWPDQIDSPEFDDPLD
jgi:hypothetical protein